MTDDMSHVLPRATCLIGAVTVPAAAVKGQAFERVVDDGGRRTVGVWQLASVEGGKARYERIIPLFWTGKMRPLPKSLSGWVVKSDG